MSTFLLLLHLKSQNFDRTLSLLLVHPRAPSTARASKNLRSIMNCSGRRVDGVRRMEGNEARTVLPPGSEARVDDAIVAPIRNSVLHEKNN